MIRNRMKPYEYSLYGELDEYGQEINSNVTIGTVLMAIHLLTENVSNNALYSDATYLGLTIDDNINESYLIKYGDENLKVNYVNRSGRYNQVFLSKINDN